MARSVWVTHGRYPTVHSLCLPAHVCERLPMPRCRRQRSYTSRDLHKRCWAASPSRNRDRTPRARGVIPFVSSELGGGPVSRASSGWRAKVCAFAVIAVLSLMAVGVQGIAVDGQAGASTNAVPTIDGRSVKPTEVSSGGGIVTLRASVAHASTCTFSSTPKVPGLPAKIDCMSGSAPVLVSRRVTIPGNSGKERIYYHFVVSATGTTTVKSGEFNLVEESSTSGAKPGRPTSVFATPHDGSAT